MRSSSCCCPDWRRRNRTFCSASEKTLLASETGAASWPTWLPRWRASACSRASRCLRFALCPCVAPQVGHRLALHRRFCQPECSLLCPAPLSPVLSSRHTQRVCPQKAPHCSRFLPSISVFLHLVNNYVVDLYQRKIHSFERREI